MWLATASAARMPVASVPDRVAGANSGPSAYPSDPGWVSDPTRTGTIRHNPPEPWGEFHRREPALLGLRRPERTGVHCQMVSPDRGPLSNGVKWRVCG